MQGRHTGNAADAPCFPVSSSKTTCQMRARERGRVCLPDMDVVCLLIGVWWRYVSDGRARDERGQGNGSRKLREPGIFGISLVYAANMRIPQSCVNLHHICKDAYMSCACRQIVWTDGEQAGWSAAVAGLFSVMANCQVTC